MSSHVATLVEMGFTAERAEKALQATGNRGVEAAVEWLWSHSEDSAPATSGVVLGSGATTGSSTAGAEDEASASGDLKALSLMCQDCGQKLKSEQDCHRHAARTGHQNFAESAEAIKPLTPEQKQEQLEKLKQRMAEKKKELAEREKTEALEAEKRRRQAGKERAAAQAALEAAQLKRQQEEAAAAIARKLNGGVAPVKTPAKPAVAPMEVTSATAPAPAPAPVAAPAAAAPAAAAAAPAAPKVYTECKLQLRDPKVGNATLVLKPSDTLAAVFADVKGRRGPGPVKLSTTFPPKRTFTEADGAITLQDAGLVPSAVLMVS